MQDFSRTISISTHKASHSFLTALLFIISLTLSACGGGGGSGETLPTADTTAPTITLNGSNPYTMDLGDSYAEPGATASDNRDGDVSVTISGSVNSSIAGIYSITYSATDSAGNTSTATRTVDVLMADTTPPVINLNGDNPLLLTQGNSYIEPGASAADERDGSVSVSISGTVETTIIGSYSISYSATDTAGNVSTVSRTVEVLGPDTTAPVITITGANFYTLGQGNSYIEAGATATDDRDGNVSVSISGTVDTNTVGNYIITYTASDSANNTAITTRTIEIVPSRPFITTWKTDNFSEATADNQIMIGTAGTGYNYTVDWGDGQSDTNVTGNITHTYAVAGTYTVSISGDFPRIYFYYPGYDNYKILSVEQWGTNRWHSMSRAFVGCINLVVNATDVPDLSQVTDMSEMFSGASAFNQDISNWDVSNVTNMSYLFYFASAFEQDLSTWDVASVTNMSQMFAYGKNPPGLELWDVSSVTDMSDMFRNATTFNRDISAWDVSSVTSMSDMFSGAKAFNQDITGWNVSAVTDMNGMFYGTDTFNQDISIWDVSSVTDMNSMFLFADVFNQPIGNWDVSAVTNMRDMFSSASAFNQPLNNWNVSAVTNMGSMFAFATSFNQPLSNWDVSSVVFMYDMFLGATIFNQDLSNWNVTSVTSMVDMFRDATSFDQNIGTWNISTVKYMDSMFYGAGLSTTNYDILLTGWSNQSLQLDVSFDAGSSQYSSSSQSARDTLTNSFGWFIQDGGIAP